MVQSEIIFLVEESLEGGLEAKALGYSIYSEAETLGELKEAVRDAVRCHFRRRGTAANDPVARSEGRALDRMRLPRDIGGEELAKLLGKYGYEVTRQTGSHMRLSKGGEHRITIPRHKPLKVGTLSSILGDVAEHLQLDRDTLVRELFG